jgi:DnaJ-class molecular chaperone
MDNYQQKLQALQNKKCETCSGTGECNDADFGDMYFNTWKCLDCNGKGLNEHIS